MILKLSELEALLRQALPEHSEPYGVEEIINALREVCSDEIVTPQQPMGTERRTTGVIVREAQMLALEIEGPGLKIPLTANYQTLCNTVGRFNRKHWPRKYTLRTRNDCYIIVRAKDRGEATAEALLNGKPPKRRHAGRPLELSLEGFKEQAPRMELGQRVNITEAVSDIWAEIEKLEEQHAPMQFAAAERGEGYQIRRMA